MSKTVTTAEKREAVLVDIPDENYLMIEGTGDPNTSQEYEDAIEALHDVASTLRRMIRKEVWFDEPALPLESLWWTDNMQEFSMDNKGLWHWTVMVMLPEYVAEEFLERVLKQVKKKKDSPALAKICLGRLHEGLSAQIMYMGPSAAEGPTIEELHAFIKEHRYASKGKHHEIYLGDPHRTAPEKLRMVIRQPVELLA